MDEKRIREIVREEICREANETKELLLDAIEHELVGSGRVIDAERARRTPCKCFTVEEDGFEACWSPGVLGLMTSKKNPEQIAEFCTAGKTPAGEGVKERYGKIRTAITEAHERWERGKGGLPEWWKEVAESLKRHGIEL